MIQLIRRVCVPINYVDTGRMTMTVLLLIGTVGRESGQVRLRVIHNTDRKTLEEHVHRFTDVETICNTDEWQGYNHIIREHKTVCHAEHE